MSCDRVILIAMKRLIALLVLTCALVLAQAPAGDVFDVRNGDQNGKLMFKETELAFESLTDSKHSRNWKYSEIREVSKKKKNLRIRPMKGSTYDFQFKDGKLRDRIYDMIASRVVAARQAKK